MGVNPTTYNLRLVLPANRGQPWPATRTATPHFQLCLRPLVRLSPSVTPARHVSRHQHSDTHPPRAPATATADPWPCAVRRGADKCQAGTYCIVMPERSCGGKQKP